MITVSTVSVSIVAVNLMVVVAVLLGLVVCGDDQGSLWLYNVKSLLCHGSTAGILSCSRVCIFQFLFCTVNCIVRELH